MTNNFFWSLKPADKAKLIQYQWKVHGCKLEIPAPEGVTITKWREAMEESSEEIDKIMRRPPRRQKRLT